MNFKGYFKKETVERTKQAAKFLQHSRNSIVNEVLEKWLNNHTKTKWLKNFLDFSPIKDVPDFKSMRKDLKDNTSEDPLA